MRKVRLNYSHARVLNVLLLDDLILEERRLQENEQLGVVGADAEALEALIDSSAVDDLSVGLGREVELAIRVVREEGVGRRNRRENGSIGTNAVDLSRTGCDHDETRG